MQALGRLVDAELSKDEILSISRLGIAGVGRILDIFQHEDRSTVNHLLGSLEDRDENTLGTLIDVMTSKFCRSLADSNAGRTWAAAF